MSRQREFGQFDGGAGQRAARSGKARGSSKAGSTGRGTRTGSGSRGGTGGTAPTVDMNSVRHAMRRGRKKST